jgi:hypothetical protein
MLSKKNLHVLASPSRIAALISLRRDLRQVVEYEVQKNSLAGNVARARLISYDFSLQSPK